MSRENDISAVLQQYIAETGVRSVKKVEQDFVEVAQRVPAEALTNGLSEAIQSERTPPFEQMVGESFERGDSEQRAGVLRRLLAGAGPSVVQPFIEKGVLRPGTERTDGEDIVVHHDATQQLSAEIVQQIAQELVLEDPDIIERMSSLYAEDPALGRTLGGATLSVALGKIAESR